MLEFVAIYLLARRNGNVVERKGRDGFNYKVLTAVLWIGGEVLGFMVGFSVLNATDSLAAYPAGIAGAAAGALISWVIASSVPAAVPGWLRTHVVPPGGMPAWVNPDPSVSPAAVLPSGLDLCVRSAQGDWACVQAANGWTGWVDGRYLVQVPGHR